MLKPSHLYAAMLLSAVSVCCAPSPAGGSSDPPSAEADPAVLRILVTSGRPQSSPVQMGAAVATPVVIQIEGLGPPRASVFAHDGSRIATTDAPLTRGGTVVGTNMRFVPSTQGKFRVELAEAPGVVLAWIEAR